MSRTVLVSATGELEVVDSRVDVLQAVAWGPKIDAPDEDVK